MIGEGEGTGYFLGKFWTFTAYPPINYVHGYHMYHMDVIGHVAAAPNPLACRPRNCQTKK